MPDAPALAKALEKLRGSLGAETLGEAEGRIEIAAAGATHRSTSRRSGTPRAGTSD